jgi:hypothetical protein
MAFTVKATAQFLHDLLLRACELCKITFLHAEKFPRIPFEIVIEQSEKNCSAVVLILQCTGRQLLHILLI